LEGLKGTVSSETFKEPSQREDAKKVVKKLLEERYISGKNRWFFTALRVSGCYLSYQRTIPDTRIVFPSNSSKLLICRSFCVLF